MSRIHTDDAPRQHLPDGARTEENVLEQAHEAPADTPARHAADDEERVEEASRESFPASDPPAHR